MPIINKERKLAMITRATEATVAENWTAVNLFLPVPDTKLRSFIEKVDDLVRFAPGILDAVEADLDTHAKKKKKLRLADKEFFASQTASLPGINMETREIPTDELKLNVGRPRMSAYMVYLFMMIRGFMGGTLISKEAKLLLHESMSLYCLFQNRSLKKMPRITTILENVNAISNATRDLIFKKQIEVVLDEELDDFKKLTIDSTSVKANSCWPTDSKMLTELLTRANRMGQQLHNFGLNNFHEGRSGDWLKEMYALDFRICLVAGKPKSKGKMKKHYRHLLKRGQRVATFLLKELNQFEQNISIETILPSRRVLLQRILQQIRSDISDGNRVIKYANDRVFKGKVLPSKEKVLSMSDGSAAYIEKGGREAVIGYKPQLVRSENGFVAGLFVPEGNASDSKKLVPVISDAMKRTGVTAELVSSDDGYASAEGRKEVLAMKVNDISISGSKGRKLTDESDWESDTYRDARRNRSAVESLMFTIKDGFEFGELGRRGIEAVRAELMEKVLAYNFCRIVLIKKRKREALEKVA